MYSPFVDQIRNYGIHEIFHLEFWWVISMMFFLKIDQSSNATFDLGQVERQHKGSHFQRNQEIDQVAKPIKYCRIAWIWESK
jgi:hypothetical protein